MIKRINNPNKETYYIYNKITKNVCIINNKDFYIFTYESLISKEEYITILLAEPERQQ